MYIPPFTVSAEAINLIAEIASQIERYAIRLEQEDGLRLRKINRVKTIHSSLAIEGNKLSEDEVRDIIDGKIVIAPLREIQEVKNAIATYELYPKLDAFKEEDLLQAHGVMMQALVDDAGHYRRGGVGVFGEKGLVHLAPPAERVPMLMSDLFNCTNAGESGPFIDFMLQEIHKTLKAHQGEPLPDKQQYKVPNKVPNKVPDKLKMQYPEVSDACWNVYLQIKANSHATTDEIGQSLSISDRMVRKHIATLRGAQLIERIGGNKTGYWKVNK